MTAKSTSKKSAPVLDVFIEDEEVTFKSIEDDLTSGIASFEDMFIDEEEEPEEVEDALSIEVDVEEDAKPTKKKAVSAEPTISMAPTKGTLSTLEGLITEIDDSVEYLTWLIYGKNGTGKTTILSTVEGMLILAAEDGTLSIRDKAKGKAMKIKIDTWEKVEGVYWMLKSGKRKDGGIAINTKSGEFIVKSLGIDTVTKMIEVCMRNVILGEKETDADKDVLKKTLRNWGDTTEKMKYWLQQFKELPIQKVWLFQESANAEDLDSDEYTIFPASSKSIRLYAMAEADVIARTYIVKQDKGIQFRLSALPNPLYITKDRTNTLTGAIPNPDLSKLYKLVFK